MDNPSKPALAEAMNTGHLSASEAATAAGISTSTVRRILDGKTRRCRQPVHRAIESLRDVLRAKQGKVA